MDKQQVVSHLFDILQRSQDAEYIGEAISQLEHSLQAAHFARKMGAPEAVVLASLLHDIGHLDPGAGNPEMAGLGIVDHEGIGADYLQALGVSPEITELVRHHVQAKRYLCWKNPTYLKHLSEASRGTLEFQGGPMSDDEARAYEANPHFEARIQVRRCDEMAKRVDFVVEGLEAYRESLLKFL